MTSKIQGLRQRRAWNGTFFCVVYIRRLETGEKEKGEMSFTVAPYHHLSHMSFHLTNQKQTPSKTQVHLDKTQILCTVAYLTGTKGDNRGMFWLLWGI